jgi:serine/threonine protein phosphatase PrpC
MSAFETAFATETYRDRNEDRLLVLQTDNRTVVAVVDGAGGVGSGDVAAETVIAEIRNEFEHIHSALEWSEFLTQLDCRVGVGQATAVIVDIRSYGVAGASVGDCQAWMLSGESIIDLTEKQIRKPLLGSGTARPIGFTRSKLEGTLMIGSDGLFNYAKRDAIIRAIATTEFFSIPRACVDLVRLPSGELWDDISVVAIRHRPRSTTRKKYSI